MVGGSFAVGLYVRQGLQRVKADRCGLSRAPIYGGASKDFGTLARATNVIYTLASLVDTSAIYDRVVCRKRLIVFPPVLLHRVICSLATGSIKSMRGAAV